MTKNTSPGQIARVYIMFQSFGVIFGPFGAIFGQFWAQSKAAVAVADLSCDHSKRLQEEQNINGDDFGSQFQDTQVITGPFGTN